MRVPPVLLTAAAALALAGPAGAKELTRAELCGPAGCVVVTDPDQLRNVPLEGHVEVAQPPLQAFHVLRLTLDTGGGNTDTSSLYYVDRAGTIAFRAERPAFAWWRLQGAEATLMKELARTVEAYPAPRVVATTVGGRAVDGDPASYLALHGHAGPPLDTGTIPSDWLPIDFVSAMPSPWTDAPFELMYSPSANAIERGTRQIVLPDELAADIEAGLPLAPATGTRWLPWLVVAGLCAALLLLAYLGSLLRPRVDAAPTPEPTA